MKLRWLGLLAGFFLVTMALPIQAADLMEVYYQATHADPTFKKAEADWQSAKENLPIARAGYLPQLDITGNWQRQYTLVSPLTTTDANGINTSTTYLLTLTQPIFNFATWKAIKSAAASVKAATATYAAAEQDLMVRTATAYFSVLQAYDQLRYTLSRKRAVYQQLEQAQEQFKVGLIAITGVYDARSVYDQAAATAIADKNRLNDTIERLRAITGHYYFRMKSISYSIPLVHPVPNNIDQWVQVAQQQNYSLKAQNYSVISARETIKQQAAGWMPQINFVSTYTENRSSGIGVFPTTTNEGATAGLQLNFPLIQGGLVTAQTKQAAYNYLSASSQLLFVEREVVSETRQSFLGVITGVSQVKADLAAVRSAQNALEATKVGYEVGTRTMVDVLDDLTALYREQQRYTDDQYRYIIDTIELKSNAGTLKPEDLSIVNSWLKKSIKVNVPPKAFGPKLKPIAAPVPLSTEKTPEPKSDSDVKPTTKDSDNQPIRSEEEIKRRIEKLKERIKQQGLDSSMLPKKSKHKVAAHKPGKNKSHSGKLEKVVAEKNQDYKDKLQKIKIRKHTESAKLKKLAKPFLLPQPTKTISSVQLLPKPTTTSTSTQLLPKPKSTTVMQSLPMPKKTVVIAKKTISSSPFIIPLSDNSSRPGAKLPRPN